MAEPAPKCGRCNGWGHEPERHPLELCRACGGSGKPRKQEELIDG